MDITAADCKLGDFVVTATCPTADKNKITSYYDGLHLIVGKFGGKGLRLMTLSLDYRAGETSQIVVGEGQKLIADRWTEMKAVEQHAKDLAYFAGTVDRGEKPAWASHIYTKAKTGAREVDRLLVRMREEAHVRELEGCIQSYYGDALDTPYRPLVKPVEMTISEIVINGVRYVLPADD